MKNLYNYYIIKTYGSPYRDKAPFKMSDVGEIIVDTSWNPQENAKVCAEVHSVPYSFSTAPIDFVRYGSPDCYDFPMMDKLTAEDCFRDIQVGDTIYHHYNVMASPMNFIKKEVEYINDVATNVLYFRVSPGDIICTVREGKIIMNNSYVLVNPDMETWDEILIPTYTDMVGLDGKRIPKPKEQWLQTKVAPEKKYLYGFIENIGVGDKFYDLGDEVKKGDRILYKRNADWTVKIEGKDYFVIKQKNLLCIC
jgi:hypothetical protein